MSAPFLRPDAGPLRPWILGAMIVVQGAVLWSLWAASLQSKRIRSFYERRAKVIGVAFATFLIILALLIWRR
jgi:threonine/homoserine/homoserine lactone efflux protein